MKRIIVAIIAVTVFIVSGCKSSSVVADTNVERDLFITAKINSATMDEVMKVCSALDIIYVDEYYTGIIYEPDNEISFIEIKNYESGPLVKLKLTSKTNNSEILKQTRNSLLRLDGILSVDIK